LKAVVEAAPSRCVTRFASYMALFGHAPLQR
jgi:hypothetical protein